MPQLISLTGLFVMIGLAWLMSSHKTRVSPRVVLGGLLLQFAVAWLVLKTAVGESFLGGANALFDALLGCVKIACGITFGSAYQEGSVAFFVLPTMIFFSAIAAVLFHWGVIQRVVWVMARVMQKTLGTSGAETLSAAANVFVGQTEAPLIVKPYLNGMTRSELNSVMVGGFATIAGGVMAAYVGMGIPIEDLLAASVISAPAALLIAKVMQPEVDTPETLGTAPLDTSSEYANTFDAIAGGATNGLKLALNVGAMLIAFLALIFLANGLIAWLAGQAHGLGLVGGEAPPAWSLEAAFGWCLTPLAWLMGIAWEDCGRAGELLGVKWFATEFVAYQRLAEWTAAGGESALKPLGETIERESILQPRSATILTYALCGFANFPSIGVQLGGLGAVAPDRRADLAKLALRAMIGGSLAAFMTACVAGVLL